MTTCEFMILRTHCATPGCNVIVAGGLCASCRGRRQTASRTRDRERGTSAQRGYGARWRVRRLAFLQIHPYCTDPAGRHPHERRRSDTTDHVVPLASDGADDETNWQAVCWSCHSSKTASQDGGFGRLRRQP